MQHQPLEFMQQGKQWKTLYEQPAAFADQAS
jgi:hypothetical protein